MLWLAQTECIVSFSTADISRVSVPWSFEDGHCSVWMISLSFSLATPQRPPRKPRAPQVSKEYVLFESLSSLNVEAGLSSCSCIHGLMQVISVLGNRTLQVLLDNSAEHGFSSSFSLTLTDHKGCGRVARREPETPPWRSHSTKKGLRKFHWIPSSIFQICLFFISPLIKRVYRYRSDM